MFDNQIFKKDTSQKKDALQRRFLFRFKSALDF